MRALFWGLLLVVLLVSLNIAAAALPPAANVTEVLNERTKLLQKFASLRDKGNCSSRSGTVAISLKYGREGNLWMQYLNLIWVSKYLNMIPVISPSVSIFKHFDLTYLQSAFCTTTKATRGPKSHHLNIRANEIHGFYHLYKKWGHLLPPQHSAEAIETAAEDTLFFFAAVYGGLKQHHVDMLAGYITNHLHAGFNYVVIQRRNYEGSCLNILYRYCQYSDFSSDQYDLNTDEWNMFHAVEQSLGRFKTNYTYWIPQFDTIPDPQAPPMPNYHPLCNMTVDLVQSALRAHFPSVSSSSQKNPMQYVLMSDQQQPVTPAFSAALHPISYTGPEASLMDRLLGTHSALLIRNVASSFSISCEVLRRILSLPLSSLADNSTADFFFADFFSFQNLTSAYQRRKNEFAAALLLDKAKTKKEKEGNHKNMNITGKR